MNSLNLNESVYIAGHGIGVLKEVKTLEIQGHTQSLMAFEVVDGTRIMIPEGSQAMAKLRAPIKEDAAQKVIELLKASPEKIENKPNYKKWNRMIQATIQAGDTKDLAALVAKLDAQRTERPLAINESRLLDTAKQILKSELELVLGKEALADMPDVSKILRAA